MPKCMRGCGPRNWAPVPGFAATVGELSDWTNGRGDVAESEHTSIDSEVRPKLKIQASRSAGARPSSGLASNHS